MYRFKRTKHKCERCGALTYYLSLADNGEHVCSKCIKKEEGVE